MHEWPLQKPEHLSKEVFDQLKRVLKKYSFGKSYPEQELLRQTRAAVENDCERERHFKIQQAEAGVINTNLDELQKGPVRRRRKDMSHKEFKKVLANPSQIRPVIQAATAQPKHFNEFHGTGWTHMQNLINNKLDQ